MKHVMYKNVGNAMLVTVCPINENEKAYKDA